MPNFDQRRFEVEEGVEQHHYPGLNYYIDVSVIHSLVFNRLREDACINTAKEAEVSTHNFSKIFFNKLNFFFAVTLYSSADSSL